MKKAGCILTLLVALGVVWFIYRTAVTGGIDTPPAQQIDAVGVRMDLLGIAQAERIFLATHGRYGTLEELVESQAIAFTTKNRRGYDYEAEVDGDREFRIVATPVDPAKAAWPTLAIDQNMQVTQVLEE